MEGGFNLTVYDVTTFGAVGDGSVDDTAAFEAAIAAMPAEGGVLYAPQGLYSINLTVNQSKRIHLKGDGYGSRLQSFAVDGWAVVFDTLPRHYVSDIAFHPNVPFPSRNSNGCAIGNAAGVDFDNTQFRNCLIGLHLYKTSYGNHRNLRFNENDIGLLFSKRGGVVTDPDTVMAFPDFGDAFENLSNKSFMGCQFLLNRVGIFFDYDTVLFIERVVFRSISMEGQEIAIGAIEKVGEPVAGGTIADDLVQFRTGWFEANATAPGTETIFGRVLPRGDVSVRSGRFLIESFQVAYAEVSGIASLAFDRCNLLWSNGNNFIRRTEDGIINLTNCRRGIGNVITEPLSSNTPGDQVFPSSTNVPSGWVRPLIHAPVKGFVSAKFGDDFTGATLPTGVSFGPGGSPPTPTFQVVDGPFNACIELSVTQGDGTTIKIDRTEDAIENKLYVILLNIKSSAVTQLFSITGQVNMTRTEIEADTWYTVGGITLMPAPGAPVLPTRTEIALDFATSTIRLGGASIIQCDNDVEVQSILATGTLPVPLT